MNRPPNPLIAQMAAELQPVRSIKFRDGLMLVVAAMLATVLSVELVQGLWRGAWSGQASALFLITNGLLLVLGCASVNSVLKMVSPRVGNKHEGPKWAMAMVAVLPLAAFASLLGRHPGEALIGDPHGLVCFGAALVTSLLIAGTLVLWLRRGAPVSPATAGVHIGVAATALGSAAYGLACTLEGFVHLGFWHVMPVVVGAIVGRVVLPSFLRW